MMIHFKIFALLFLFSRAEILYSQQQETIPWPSLADSPWPILRGDMQGTGRSKYIGPRTKNVIWRKDMPLGVIYGPVIGYSDNLYMGTRSISDNSDNFFYALDKNGINVWTFITETFYPNNVGPTLASDSTLYFGSRNTSVYALDFHGNKKWSISNLSIGVLNFIISLDKTGKLYLPIADTLQIIPEAVSQSRKFLSKVFAHEG